MHQPYDLVRRRLLFGMAALGAGIALPKRAAAEPARPIEIGLMPYMPTARLIEAHESLRRHVETTFRRPAVLSTAPDFKQFQRRVLHGEFDLILSGGNLAWQAWLDAGIVPIAVSRRFVIVQLIVAADSPIASVAELREKSVATIDPITTVAQLTVQLLHEGGLDVGRNVRLVLEKTPFNCAQAVVLGEVAAAGFPDISFLGLTPDMRSKLRVIKESTALPGVMFSCRRAADIPTPAQFQTALLHYAQETQAGRDYVKDLGHEALLKPDFKRLKVLDSLVPEVRRIMAQS